MPKPRKHFSEAQRKQAVARLLSGEENSEDIARSLGVTLETLYSWRDSIAVIDDERRYRAVSDEYAECIKGRWPKQVPAKQWFRDYCGSCSSAEYSDLCGQEYVLEKYAVAFVAMLIAKDGDSDLKACDRSTAIFLRQFGIERLSQDNAGHALEHMFTPASIGKRPVRPLLDFLSGFFGLLGERELGELDERLVRGINKDDPGDMASAVDWIYTRLGQCTSPQGVRLPAHEAARLGEAAIGASATTYTDNAIGWISKYPWTVVKARRNKLPYGVSVVLPVTREAYQDIVSGKRAPFRLTPSDLIAPSTHIILEAAAERPEFTNDRTINELSWPIAVSMAFQLGALIRSHRFRSPTAIHFASFNATPKNATRLAKTGFKPTGAYMAGSKNPIVQKIVEVGTTRMLGKKDLILLAALSSVAADEPPMDDL